MVAVIRLKSMTFVIIFDSPPEGDIIVPKSLDDLGGPSVAGRAEICAERNGKGVCYIQKLESDIDWIKNSITPCSRLNKMELERYFANVLTKTTCFFACRFGYNHLKHLFVATGSCSSSVKSTTIASPPNDPKMLRCGGTMRLRSTFLLALYVWNARPLVSNSESG
jgi:hypothetical protein